MKKEMKIKTTFAIVLVGLGCFVSSGIASRRRGIAPSDQSEVRAAVQRIFDQLKAREYEALYDSLPSSSRSRITRDRFAAALQRSRNLYQLDRIELGVPSISGNLAGLDAEIYAHLPTPVYTDASLLAQQ